MTPIVDIYGQRYLLLQARFSTAPQSGPASLTVAFTEHSILPTTDSREWDFGDGETSTEENPSHEYLTPGSYTVVFTATWASQTYTATHLINVSNPVQAQFTASPVQGPRPLTVTFSDESQTASGTITDWRWDFGDGATSTEQQPSHVYTSAGQYTVQLIASTGTYSATKVKTHYVSVTPPYHAVITYTYDGLYRLTDANYSTGQRFQYAYDAVGNRTVQTRTLASTEVIAYAYDEANRLIEANGTPYTWDDNGNLIDDDEKTYIYNQANRLTAIEDGSSSVTYAYNGDGVRLQQENSGAVIQYTQDLAAPLPVVLQSQADENTTQYVYALSTRPLAQYLADTPEYLLPDALGSVRQIVDANGNVTLAESYEPYGSVLSSNGTASSIFAYAGEETDTYIKLLFLRSRYYSPETARFLSKDVWQGDYTRPQSLNAWTYTENNSINATDPSGWITEKEATSPGGANDIVEGLLQTYHVRIVKDWGFVPFLAYPTMDRSGMGPIYSYWECPTTWREGNWRTLNELEWIAESVRIVATGLGGNEKIQSALGGELKIIRLKQAGSFAPPGILSWALGGDIVLGDDIGGDEIFTKGTIPHEFAHVWDYRTDNRLSHGLMEALGTWKCLKRLGADTGICHWDPFAKHFDPATNSYVYPEIAPGSNPNCGKGGPPDPNDPFCAQTSYANTYGGSALFTGPGWEDWATSFEAFVYPERLLNYRLQTALVSGGVRERYVREKINSVP